MSASRAESLPALASSSRMCVTARVIVCLLFFFRLRFFFSSSEALSGFWLTGGSILLQSSQHVLRVAWSCPRRRRGLLSSGSRRIQTVPGLHPARASVVRFSLFRTNVSQTDVPVKAGKGNRGLPHHPDPKHRAACLSRFSLFFTERGTRVDRDRPSSKRAERCSGKWMITV